VAGQDKVGLVGDNPLDGLALGELHRLGHGRGEVDIVLFTGFALDELNFCWESHNVFI
jgi:hypothetical protein